MRTGTAVVLVAMVGLCSFKAGAQVDMSSEASLNQFRAMWREAWRQRDVDKLASLVAEDLDWIAADGTWLKGRRAFHKHHARLFAMQFKDAQWKTLDERVQILAPGTALAITATEISNDTDAGGKARASRRSVGTRLYTRQGANWLLKASHNTIISAGAR